LKEDLQVDELCERLRQLHAHDQEERLIGNIKRLIEDPLRPSSEGARFRVNPVLLLLTAFAAIAAGTFLYLSFGRG
jgi:hypothetical protein